MASVLITGANERLSLETARQLVRAGHTVWLGSRDLGRGEAGTRPVQLDVTSDESVAAAAEAVAELDVLVNADLARETFEDTLACLARVLHAFLPLLERSSAPVVVNVSGQPASVSAAAVNMVTVQYAKAFPNVRINAVEPGAASVVRMAQIGQDGPTGGYFDADGPLPW
ncbi:short-chain dehydrogenase [Lentzea rhizosphaerae]|uniref:Short-chain dehydrogenase n=1 Tax=Lentzea rhizosphaerae TaxID=2041025 RepID=A0ABV8C1Z9_9PSEU